MFGFCKLRDQCKRIHFKKKCEDVIVSEMAKKMVMLEAELKQIKRVQSEGETTIETNSIVKDPEIIKDAQQDQVTTEWMKKLKAVKEKDDRIKTKEGKDSYKCEKFDYFCKRFETLNKHRNTKHTGHACNVCGKISSTQWSCFNM